MSLRQQRRGTIAASGAVAAFAPTDIAGLQFWFDADDAASFTFGTGTAVAQWNDKSGNGRHMVQATGANQPTRNGSQNSRTTVVFDGSSQYLRYSTSYTGPYPFTYLFAVKDTEALATNRQIFTANANGCVAWLSNSNPAKWGEYNGSVFDSSVTCDTAWHQLSMVFNQPNSQVWVDAASGGTGSEGTLGAGSSPWTLGASSGGANTWKGEIAEVLMYDTVLSTGNRQAVEAYLKAKWGTP